MRDDVRQALAVDRTTPMEARTIDVTTTGRRSGQPRRVEILFYRFEDDVYLSGRPGDRPRAWLLNLVAEPRFVFHLKRGVSADLPAIATVVTDPDERRRILGSFVEQLNERHTPDGPWTTAVLEEWVQRSPLARVRFPDAD